MFMLRKTTKVVLSSFFFVFSSAMFAEESSAQCIFVEGIVGSGKSTLVSLIQQHLPGVQVIQEPLEKWLDVEGNGDLYDLFLKNTQRWAFTTEFYVPFARAITVEEKIKNMKTSSAGENIPIVIVDRSMYMDRYCFAKTAKKMGAMDNLEWEIYCQWFKWFMKHFSIKPAGFIYLQASVQTTLDRIKKRDRIEEQDYPVELQKNFHQCFEDFFINKTNFLEELGDVPILVLDANKDFEHNLDLQKEYFDQIKKFINKSIKLLDDSKEKGDVVPYNKEIEVRIQIDDLSLQKMKAWLEKNATFQGRLHHIEYYLNKPATTFFFESPEGYRDALDYLRVRLTEDGDSFCFKKFHVDPIENRPLYCDEYEIEISDGQKMLGLMKALGYTNQTLMEKTRETYCFDCFEIVIDQVKNLGVFVEVELKKGVPGVHEGISLIYNFLKLIGVTKFKMQTRGYISMLWNPEFNFGKEVVLSEQ